MNLSRRQRGAAELESGAREAERGDMVVHEWNEDYQVHVRPVSGLVPFRWTRGPVDVSGTPGNTVETRWCTINGADWMFMRDTFCGRVRVYAIRVFPGGQRNEHVWSSEETS